MKKSIQIIIWSVLFITAKAQVQFKISDPTTANGILELKKADFYLKQLKDLGFTDKDVTIKTYPIRKFYSDAAGPITRALVEADRAEFYLEASTKKNAKGVIYKMEGFIVFTRNDVAADDWGSYNAKFNNTWKVYHKNVTDFLPANQKYILEPEAVKKMIISGLSNGTVKANFLSDPYEGYFNDIISLGKITYADEKMVGNGIGVKTEMINATEQRYGFLWDATCAKFSPDTGYIFEVFHLKNISSEVTIRIENGEPKIQKCYFYNSGEEVKIFNEDLGGRKAYDTLFAGLSWIGTDAVLGRKKIITTNTFQGEKMKEFLSEFANQFNKIKGNEKETELEQLFKNYISKEYLSSLISSTYNALQKGFIPKSKLESNGHKIEWMPNTKAAKKTSIGWKLINNSALRYMKLEQGKYKYNRELDFR